MFSPDVSFLWDVGRFRFDYFHLYFVAAPKFLALNPARMLSLRADKSANC